MSDDDTRVPAGWYPDPLGLPQLRWWDNHSWTEHTSDARRPVAPSQSRPATRVDYADPFEVFEPRSAGTATATDDDSDLLFGTPNLAYADPARSLAAPDYSDLFPDEASPAQRYASYGVPAGAPTSQAYNLDSRFDDLLGGIPTPRTATSHLGDQEEQYIPDAEHARRGTATSEHPARGAGGGPRSPYRATGGEAPAPSRATHGPRASAEIPRQVGTGPVWSIALLPLALLVLGLLFLLSGLAGPASPVFLALVIVVPYLLVVILAFADSRALARLGFEQPPHWAWAFLTAPVYLVVRMTAVVRESGRGFGPLMTWVSLAVVLAGSVIAVPGLVIALAPDAFAQEAETSVQDAAATLGGDIALDCPEMPPLLVGQSFGCAATNSRGQEFVVTVSLQRANGWINWRVDDWGIFTM
ncbi:DUF2510 domain-containing protein [uncultured Schumannella sp.]|uniref:DUF2510 domain-containing protein n=1 Tax=uncultured Schumannella sp. TaxID=1195956 RepID=UPI0025E5332E|nr:DUF2510 domain-containing protein [uncultured Schumannella sp.]